MKSLELEPELEPEFVELNVPWSDVQQLGSNSEVPAGAYCSLKLPEYTTEALGITHRGTWV